MPLMSHQQFWSLLAVPAASQPEVPFHSGFRSENPQQPHSFHECPVKARANFHEPGFEFDFPVSRHQRAVTGFDQRHEDGLVVRAPFMEIVFLHRRRQ